MVSQLKTLLKEESFSLEGLLVAKFLPQEIKSHTLMVLKFKASLSGITKLCGFSGPILGFPTGRQTDVHLRVPLFA